MDKDAIKVMSEIAKNRKMVPDALDKATHIGMDDLPWVSLAKGVEAQVLQIDLHQGLWIVRNRFAPGTTIQRHYHTGPVFAVTHQGSWFYTEYPDEVNSAGSYLFEPAGSVHTLTIPADQDEPTIVWFAIWGPNVHMNDDGTVDYIYDAHANLHAYRELTEIQGKMVHPPIVVGES